MSNISGFFYSHALHLMIKFKPAYLDVKKYPIFSMQQAYKTNI